jgi:hypothetical protein
MLERQKTVRVLDRSHCDQHDSRKADNTAEEIAVCRNTWNENALRRRHTILNISDKQWDKDHADSAQKKLGSEQASYCIPKTVVLSGS